MPGEPTLDPTQAVRLTIGAVPPSRRRRIWLIVGAGIVVVLGFLGVRAWRARAHDVPRFQTVVAKRGDVEVNVRATGTLQAVTTVEVGAEVTGRVLTVSVDANDLVKKGQILAEIDPEQLRALADQAAAQVASAEAAIALARATLAETAGKAERSVRLSAQKLLGQEDLDAATADHKRAQANLGSAMANETVAVAALKSARSRVDKTTIVSPIDGSVLSRLIEPGQTVTAGFTTPVLFRLAQDLTKMRLNVDVDEADVGRVHAGLPATFTVEAYPDRVFASRVVSLHNEPKTSQNVVTYEAVLEADNSDKVLLPGMTCTATIVTETKHDVLTIPNAALRFTPPAGVKTSGVTPEPKPGADGGKPKRVWILRGKAIVPVDVRPGVSDGVVTEIAEGSGVEPGTAVVVDVEDAP